MKICLFTGAGIGVPLGLPATTGFENTLSKIPRELFQQISSFFEDTKELNDIEKILYLLEDFSKANDFTFHIIQQGKYEDFKLAIQNISQYKKTAKTTVESIKSDIFEILEEYDLDKAKMLYGNLIREIRSVFQGSSISIFTTNYDLTFEDGFASDDKLVQKLGFKEIDYGYQQNGGKSIYNPEDNFAWKPDALEYKKLHGSLDWTLDKQKKLCVRSGIARQPKNPGEMPLLYPGFKGIPSTQPFVDIHEKLYGRMNSADIMLAVGFAFRDAYINNLVDFSLKQNIKLKIFCINPCKPGDFPNDSKLEEFTKKYPRQFFHIQSKIELIDNPMNLKEVMNNNKVKTEKTFTPIL